LTVKAFTNACDFGNIKSMDEKVYALRLTGEQIAGIHSLFQERGWRLELDTIDRYKEKEEVAGDYITINRVNGRASPEGIKDSFFKIFCMIVLI
jgi:hypothetical protein